MEQKVIDRGSLIKTDYFIYSILCQDIFGQDLNQCSTKNIQITHSEGNLLENNEVTHQ